MVFSVSSCLGISTPASRATALLGGAAGDLHLAREREHVGDQAQAAGTAGSIFFASA